MKMILIHADRSRSFEHRLRAAMRIAQRKKAHLRIMITTPIQQFVSVDPFGGTYFAEDAIAKAQADDDVYGAELSERMEKELMRWDVVRCSGNVVAALAEEALLADVCVVSLTGEAEAGAKGLLTFAGDIAMESGRPILAMPPHAEAAARFQLGGPVLLAWNGSVGAANALRAMVRLMDASAKVTVLTVGAISGNVAVEDALDYLEAYGFSAEHRHRETEGYSVEAVIEAQAESVNAALIVLGAYGHSRLRETLFGGTTQYFMGQSDWPLLLAH